MKDRLKGLNEEQVLQNRKKYGSNEIEKKEKQLLIFKIIDIIAEPTLILLILATTVYFMLGEYADGIIMLISVVVTCAIDVFQELKTDKALEELNKISELEVKVIRDGENKIISSSDVVVGDIIYLEEGDKVPADGIVLSTNSFGVNESLLTGESDIVLKTTKEDKQNYFKKNMCYRGTDVVNGSAYIEILEVGIKTEYGKIGHSINTIIEEDNPLKIKVNKIVKICGIISFSLFLIVMLITYVNNSNLGFENRLIESLIAGITIAIATIPEEIPVVLTVFLALGSMRLAKKNTLVKDMKAVESLGEISVLCTDKTGTLTENKMNVVDVFEYNKNVVDIAYLACQSKAFDPSEIAIKNYSIKKSDTNFNNYKLEKEYLFNNIDKMMGQIWKVDNKKILCVKGASETVLKLCDISKDELKKINKIIKENGDKGLRTFAIASKNVIEIEEDLKDYKLDLGGLIALEDPIRKGVINSINKCIDASIRVIMITGDNAQTASGIAYKIGIKNADDVITGDELEKMSDIELMKKISYVNIFARVYPNHKMRIINALQKNGEVVAMTGDGINDAPALKKADVGIAMGLRGTNVSKESADIILLDDNFNTIVDAIENGRGIYNNIKKAILYILAIHIPISLLSVLIPLLGYPPLLLPVHIIIMELLMDPTSSIIFERIKPDDNIMKKAPRKKDESILDSSSVLRFITHGLLIFSVVMINYLYLINNTTYELASTISYLILVMSIILIAYVIRSRKLFINNFIECLKDKFVVIVNTIIIGVLLCMIYIPFLQKLYNMCSLNILDWIQVIICALLATVVLDFTKVSK